MKKLIIKTPMWILVILTMFTTSMTGIMTSNINMSLANLSQKVTLDAILYVGVGYILIECFRFFNKICGNQIGTDILNKEDSKWLNIANHTNVCDVKKLTTGKIFDTMRDMGKLKNDLVSNILNGISTIIPFTIFMIELYRISTLAVIISISSVLISTVLLIVSDRCRHMSDKATNAKSKYASVLVDLFMNITTTKYLSKQKFAEETLKQYAEEASPFYLKIDKIFIHRILVLIW